MAKELFSEYKIKFNEYNVGTDLSRRQEMIEKSGQMGVPVIIIDDEVMVGYDRDTLKESLGVK
jgi:glutaredoxin 3